MLSALPGGAGMVVVYVRLKASTKTDVGKRIYALLLPSGCERNGLTWEELDVRSSPLHGAGVFPAHGAGLLWSESDSTPGLVPYFGNESVVHDNHSVRMLIKVLRGDFECVTVHDVQLRTNFQLCANGLFAVRKVDPNTVPLLACVR